ncbi:MAG: hypothetical protein JRN67_02410 [Nitrososphaerota archaeon]|nr:hypothetical protein [Nitrososphaerota archaeon]
MSFQGIWEAERRHKEGKEDRITSKLFGYLGRLPPEVQAGFLKEIRLLKEPDDLPLSVKLWVPVESEDGATREIDAVLLFERHTTIVEIKFDSALNEQQLMEEFTFAQITHPRVELFTITTDSEYPNILKKVAQKLHIQIGWASWHQCLRAAKCALEKSPNDVLTKQSLTDLIDYLDARDIKMHHGFTTQDDWDSYIRVDSNLHRLKKAITKELQSGIYNTVETPSWDERPNPIDGVWVYSISKRNGEKGFWVGIGKIKGKNQVEFAAYEEVTNNTLWYLRQKHFEVSHPGNPWQLNKDGTSKYVTYSQYLSIAEFDGSPYEEQEKEILKFVRGCRALIK